MRYNDSKFQKKERKLCTISKDFKAADHIPALLDWMRAQMKSCGGKTAVVGISGGKDSSVIAALCVEAYGRENVVGVLMPDGVQPDIDYSNGIVDFLGIKHYTFNIHGGTSGILGEMARLGIEASRQTTVNLPPASAWRRCTPSPRA